MRGQAERRRNKRLAKAGGFVTKTHMPDEGADQRGGENVPAMSPGQKVGGGRYTLIRELGRGGMGMVWLASDTRLHEEVALKFVPKAIRGDASALDDLRRETLKSRRLTHPNIIRIHDLDESAGEQPFISMEFVDGPSLAALKAQQEQRLFAWEFLRPLVQQLCEALDYAHGEKVIHRDLKPANMMLDSRGRLKLADFGIAATASESLTRMTRDVGTSGTPAYMSPQQMDGRAPRVTDDIYALGATLYELLTSKPPFYHGEITYQVRNLPPEPADQRLAELGLSNEIPADVAAMIMACLAKEPEQRPQSARAVADWIGMNFGHVSEAVEASQTREPAEAKSKGWMWGAAASAVVLLGLAGWWFKRGHTAEKATDTHAPSSDRTQMAVANEVKESSTPVAVPKAKTSSEGGSNTRDLNGGKAVEWQRIFDGKTFSGWTSEKLSQWQIKPGGQVTGTGPKAYLVSERSYSNLEFESEVMAGPEGNGGLFFRINGKRASGVPDGYEAQVDNNDPGKKTGSIFDVKNISQRLVQDNQWFKLHVIAIGNRIVILVNNQVAVDYTDTPKRFSSGKLGLQSNTKGKSVSYRDIKVKPLPVDEAAAWALVFSDQPDVQKQVQRR